MRPMTWVLIIILVVMVIVTMAAPKFIPKKEVVITRPEQLPLLSEKAEVLSAKIPEKKEHGIPINALQDMSARLGGDGIEFRQPEADPVRLEAALHGPALSPEKKMAEALKRVEAAQFSEKIKKARYGAGRAYQIKGAVFSSEVNPSKVNKEIAKQ